MQCRKHKKFLAAYSRDPLGRVQVVVNQMVKILKYDYKFFARYVGEMMAIFYETSYVLLNADVANVVDEKLGFDTMADQINAALAKFAKHREAASELAKSSLPRKMFREPWFRKAGMQLAHGFFESGELPRCCDTFFGCGCSEALAPP